jgi:hypothetical protein
VFTLAEIRTLRELANSGDGLAPPGPSFFRIGHITTYREWAYVGHLDDPENEQRVVLFEISP